MAIIMRLMILQIVSWLCIFLGLVRRHGQHRIRDQTQRNDSFTPNPAIVNVWIDAGPSLWSVLDRALLNCLKICKQCAGIEFFLGKAGTDWEACKLSHFQLLLLE